MYNHRVTLVKQQERLLKTKVLCAAFIIKGKSQLAVNLLHDEIKQLTKTSSIVKNTSFELYCSLAVAQTYTNAFYATSYEAEAVLQQASSHIENLADQMKISEMSIEMFVIEELCHYLKSEYEEYFIEKNFVAIIKCIQQLKVIYIQKAMQSNAGLTFDIDMPEVIHFVKLLQEKNKPQPVSAPVVSQISKAIVLLLPKPQNVILEELNVSTLHKKRKPKQRQAKLIPSISTDSDLESVLDYQTDASLQHCIVKQVAITEQEMINKTDFLKLLKQIGAKRCSIVGGFVLKKMKEVNIASTIKTDCDVVCDLPIAAILEHLSNQSKLTYSYFHGNLKITYLNDEFDIQCSPFFQENISDIDAYRKDAASRDFTRNTFYMNENGYIFDPSGKSIPSLGVNYLIPVTSEALGHASIENPIEHWKTLLQPDPIRLLRAIYFMSRDGLEVSPGFFSAIHESADSIKKDMEKKPGHYNSWMCKLLLKSYSLLALKLLNASKQSVIDIFFPELNIALMNSSKLEAFLRDELSSQREDKSLNYVYTVFIFCISYHSVEKQNPRYFNSIIANNPLFACNFKNQWSNYVYNNMGKIYLRFKEFEESLMIVSPRSDVGTSSVETSPVVSYVPRLFGSPVALPRFFQFHLRQQTEGDLSLHLTEQALSLRSVTQ